MNNELELLLNAQNELLACFNKENLKYFHPNTINNLILHFNEIKIEADKEWVFNNLREYFSECYKICDNFDRRNGRELYMKYLSKITDYYYENLKFTQSDRTLFVVFYLSLFLALYLILDYRFALPVIAIFIFRFIVLYKKYKQKRVYSLYY
jgi:hypothetical protein